MHWKRNGVLRKWAWSYILVFLIPISAVLINHSISIRALREEVISVNELTFNNAADNIDHYMELLRENYIYAFLSDYFTEIRRSDNMDGAFYRKTALLQDQLHNYRNGVDNMFCMIYMQDRDYLITGEISCTPDIYYRGMKHQYADLISFEKWKECLETRYSDRYFAADVMNYWKRGECLVYAKTVSEAQKESYNIIVSVPLAVIEKVTEYLNEDSYMLIHINEENTLVFHKGKVTDIPDWIDEKDYFVRMQKESGIVGITYELVFSEQSLMAELQGIKGTFWISLISVMILAFIGIMILLRINYKPLYTMIHEFGEEECDNVNEFDQLKKKLYSLTHEKDTARSLVEAQQEKLLNSRLLMIMKGRGEYQKGEFSLKGRILLTGFMVLVEESNSDEEELPFFIINNIFSELVEEEHFYHVEDGSFIFYLFDCQSAKEEDWRREISKKAEYLCSLLYDKWGMSVFGAVSEIGEEFRMLRHLYQNVIEALEYQKIAGGHGVIDVRVLPDYDELHSLAEYWKQRFGEAFAKKDVKEAKAIVEQIFSTNGVSVKNATILKMRIYEMFTVVMDIFREYVPDDRQQEEVFRYLEILMNAHTKDEMKACFCNLLQFQIGVISRQQVKEGKRMIAKVVNYVKENYMDCNLSLSSIAEALDRNPRHVSKAFKEATDMGIMDYINSIRIEKAKELMANKSYSTQEISEKVGYANVRTFRRAFEKETGETPASWRL